MKRLYVVIVLFSAINLNAQLLTQKLSTAIKQLENDNQFKHAILGMSVVDSKTGAVVFDKNAQIGLAPASCQKVITSVSAFEMLGKEYKYKTELSYEGEIVNKKLTGNLVMIGYGDPTLGSWRWQQTNATSILNTFKNAIEKKISTIDGNVFAYDRKWESNTTPNGWIWEDIGNYYGAGASSLNWRENQFDLYLQAGNKIGDKTTIAKYEPKLENVGLYNEVKTAAKGTGDNTIIYLPPYAPYGYVRGTIPIGEKPFKVSGAMPNGAEQFAFEFARAINFNNTQPLFIGSYNGIEIEKKDIPLKITATLFTHISPSLDSINYWFLKKSINLYGEAFVKTIAFEKKGFGASDTGINIIKNFWQQKGIEPSALHMLDGSGLSPANRVTTNALVTVMQFAKKQPWFPSFYNALPDMNGIKMKDGYISGVRSYTGYIKSKSGNEYTFSFIVNNFDGNAATVREKMWKVLDLLK